MTQNQFNALCEQYGISPSIALENENVLESLQNKEYDKIENLLITEF